MELKERLTVMKTKDDIESKRHKEKIELANLRFELSSKLLSKRDSFARDRHKEKMEVIDAKV